MGMKEFRKRRGMPFVKRGTRVKSTYDGKEGRVSGANAALNLNITFDGDDFSINCHPFWMIQYFDTNGRLIREYGG